jgi:hypothetical protein
MGLEKIVIDKWAFRKSKSFNSYFRRDKNTGFLRVSILEKEFGFEVKYFVAQQCFYYYVFDSLGEAVIFLDKKLIENQFIVDKPFILC